MVELAYTALEALQVSKTVNRLDYLVAQTRGKVIYDLGAYDETAVFKRGTGFWLHEALSRSASRVIGIDNSPNLPVDGLVTGPTSAILRGDIFQLGARSDIDQVSTIVAGELIEHLPNALDFLRALSGEPKLSGKTLLATTPNATAVYNSVLGLAGRESQHRDHLQVFSYKTLNTLCARAGFTAWTVIPYHATFAEMRLRSSPLLRTATALFESGVHLVERTFPLLSGGYIIHATL